LSKPKGFGGWGLKDVFIFGKALAAKSLWVFLTRDNLWQRILIDKYIALRTILDWLRRSQKPIHNVSNQWKEITLVFPIIGQFLAWKVGLGSQVRIGTYAIVGCGEIIFLPKALIAKLWEIGHCTLNSIGDVAHSTIWRQGWLNVEDLGF
jgi:hypothetical protein